MEATRNRAEAYEEVVELWERMGREGRETTRATDAQAAVQE